MPQYFTNAFHIEKSKFELCGALPSYMKQEDVDYAIYLIIGNGHREQLDHCRDYYNSMGKEDREKIKYILVDGNMQKSAGKA